MEKEPSEWEVNCEHMQAVVPNIFSDIGSDRRTDVSICSCGFEYNTTFTASLDVKTACNVAKPAAEILTLTGVHGHQTAALLAEVQEVRGSASFANCRYFWCIGQVWRLLCSGDACVFWKVEKNGEPKFWDYPSEGRCGPTITDCSAKAQTDIIDELLDMDMEPKPESLWWTSTLRDDDMRTFCGSQIQGLGSLLLRSFRRTWTPFSPR